MKRIGVSLFIVLSTLFSTHCYATWSIIAVDRKTGEIGIVGASCTFDVSWIGSIEPGKGAVIVQAASNYYAKMRGVTLMENNASAKEIMDAMMADEFEPELQQYGVILLNDLSSPLAYSGAQIKEWNGQMLGDDFAVMGNILASEQVVKKAYDAFNQNRDKSLAERLMLALKAGEEAGGDKRCETQYARSAFIMVYQPQDGAILKLAVQGIEEGGKPAVSLLNQQFDFWRKLEKDKG